jgi:subfamily B ATP-binding cassette protein MsbA
VVERGRLLWQFMHPYWKRYAGISGLNVLLAATEYAALALLMPILSSLARTAPISANSRLQIVLNHLISWIPVSNPLLAACLLMFGVATARFALQIAQQYAVTKTSGRIMQELRQRIFRLFASSDLDALLTEKQGRLVYILGTSPNKVAAALMRVPGLSASVVAAFGIFLLLVSIQWKLTLILTVVSTVFYLFVSHTTRSRIYLMGKRTAASATEANICLNEFVSGFKQITVANAVNRWTATNDALSKQISDLYAESNRLLEYPRYLMDFFAVLVVVTIIFLAQSRLGINLAAFLPTLGVFLVAFFRLVPHLANIGNAGVQVLSSLPDFELIRDVIHRPAPLRAPGTLPFKTLQREIRFDQVFFAHKDRGVLFEGLSFAIEKNKVTALVGKSGQGKTTILNLLLGFYRPLSGYIWADDTALADIDLTHWRDRIGFVSQDSFIFHATIAENISFNDPRYSRKDIETAAQVAYSHEFISEFPDGYDTVVGERGMRLSGGQQQRIAIARAVIRRPEIYIFDEATSSLDPISEKLVQQAIRALSQGHTTLIIAHRLSTIRDADNILVLEDGKISEQGTHQYLIEKQSRYWQMHETHEV